MAEVTSVRFHHCKVFFLCFLTWFLYKSVTKSSPHLKEKKLRWIKFAFWDEEYWKKWSIYVKIMTVINVWGNHLRLWQISYYSIFLLSLKSSWGMDNILKPERQKPVKLFSSIISFLKIKYSLVFLCFEMLSSVLTIIFIIYSI